MKTTNYRNMVMTLAGVLIATVATGCYGGRIPILQQSLWLQQRLQHL
jgi:hypothetical protein